MYLHYYLIEGVVSLLMCWPSVFDLRNSNANLCLGHLWSNSVTAESGCLFLLEGVATKQVDLAVGVYFIFCNGLTTVAFVMYPA